MAVDATSPSDSGPSPSIGDEESDSRSMSLREEAELRGSVAIQSSEAWVSERFNLDPTNPYEMALIRAIQVIGGAAILIGIIVTVVNEVYTTEAVNNSSGPFSPVVGDVETTGVAAMGLTVVGMIVVAAQSLMGGGGVGGMFGGGGGGGF